MCWFCDGDGWMIEWGLVNLKINSSSEIVRKTHRNRGSKVK
jgi:hypothetical protein